MHTRASKTTAHAVGPQCGAGGRARQSVGHAMHSVRRGQARGTPRAAPTHCAGFCTSSLRTRSLASWLISGHGSLSMSNLPSMISLKICSLVWP